MTIMNNKIDRMVTEVAVHINSIQEGEEFLKAASQYGFCFKPGIEFRAYESYGHQACLLLEFDGGISYCDYSWFENRNYKIVEWRDYTISQIINMTGIYFDKEVEVLIEEQHRKIRNLEQQLAEERKKYDLLLTRYNKED